MQTNAAFRSLAIRESSKWTPVAVTNVTLFLQYAAVNLHVCGKQFFSLHRAVIYASQSALRNTERFPFSLFLASIFPHFLNYSRWLRSQYRYRKVFHYWRTDIRHVSRSIVLYFYAMLVDLISLGRKADIDYTCMSQLLTVIHCTASFLSQESYWAFIAIIM